MVGKHNGEMAPHGGLGIGRILAEIGMLPTGELVCEPIHEDSRAGSVI